ncbi:hypothetical protein [Leptolinea tardivitalis]|uniref:Uncharacterized protein n=1 Tax=Leptolinea tardivitalis TaxID=229920 RepID=A0A0P6WN91_9CHLR|nr:hypothetical protein [Leptolinea tardivitalis]KPL70295.1 hypothetical protein ADM99_14125 [Leptolinea tardivitalis]GAP21854.1 hypothetical protein LTAR_02071 [Leptolinea tardivitalis]
MTALEEIAIAMGRRDEIPNQQLAKKLVASQDTAGIKELADHLHDRNSDVASDCLKTLYEIGMIAPTFIEDYADEFLKLLRSKNNRMVWGAMISLTTIAAQKADTLFPHIDLIIKTTREGSVITTDNGIKTLALIGSASSDYRSAVFPFLIEHLSTCRPKSVPQHAEHIFASVDSINKADYIRVLQSRLTDLNGTGLARVRKLIKNTDRISS